MNFAEKSLNTIELPVVLELLSQQAVGDIAKEKALALSPSSEPAQVSRWQDETTAAKNPLLKYRDLA